MQLFTRFSSITAIPLLSLILYELPAKPLRAEISIQAQTSVNRKAEADKLYKNGRELYKSGKFREALVTYQKVLAVYREIGNQLNIAKTLYEIGSTYIQLSEYADARDFLNQALVIYRQIGEKLSITKILNSLGAVASYLSEYQQALDFYKQALAANKNVGDNSSAAVSLNGIGFIYQQTGFYSQAQEYYQQSLALWQKIGDQVGIGQILKSIGVVHDDIGEYSQALKFYQQALAIAQTVKNPKEQGDILNNIGLVYQELGEYSGALEFYQQALAIRRKIGDFSGEGTTLLNIGLAYSRQHKFSRAISFDQQALVIFRKIGNRAKIGKTLNNIGFVYQELGQYSQSLEFLKEALTILEQVGNHPVIGRTFDSIGTVYQKLSNYFPALESYQQALAISQEVGDRRGERVTLSNIGDVLVQQNKPQLAIIFYKQSVNLTEEIRKDLRSLPREQQQSYTATIADTYRHLADLLLQQDRVLEAQQVLDLLKIQEIDDYLHNVRGKEKTAQGIDLNLQERQIDDSYKKSILNKEVKLGKKLTELEKIPVLKRTPEQQQQVEYLRQILEKISQKFNEFINSPEIVAYVQQLSRVTKENLNLDDINTLGIDILKPLQPKAVMLYPLILEDHLELILATPDTPPIHRRVAVNKKDLNQAILDFRNALNDPKLDAKVPGLKLYNWLIKPIEPDLSAAEAKSIIYAPDGQLRYIPLAALYDGKQWLVQRFRINNITAMSLTKFTGQHLFQPPVLAGAFATGRYNFTLGSTPYGLSGLPFAKVEVDNLAAMIPKTTELLDREFSREATLLRSNDYTIVHLATHAMFAPGKPEDSFILLGDGKLITLRDIGNWRLPNVDLVVLSACQTAISGESGNGEEILGFGFQIQLTGAKAAIASLWSVNDGGTQTLMDAFYAILHQGGVTKAEALRQAQVMMITDDFKAIGSQQDRGILQSTREKLPPKVAQNLSHPYYWAAFILIGNGL